MLPKRFDAFSGHTIGMLTTASSPGLRVDGHFLSSTYKDANMQIQQSVTINRPVSQVFAFVSNPDNNTLWQPEVIEHTMVSDGPMALGSKMRHVSKFMGMRVQANVDVTEFVPDHKITFRVTSGTLPYTIQYCLDAEGSGTRFTYSAVMDSNRWLKLAQPLIKPSAQRVIEGDLARFKALLQK